MAGVNTGGPRRRVRPFLIAGLAALLALSLVAVAAVVALSRIRVLDEQRLTDRMVDVRLWSPALRARTTVRLLLPPAYAERPDARWPSVYLLHGCCDDYHSWTRSTDIEELSATSDVLVVMPDGGRTGFYSDWLDGPGWETFHTVELPALLADRYRADERRSVAGVSMGGLGALTSLPLFISVGDGTPGPLNPGDADDPTEPFLEDENQAVRKRLTELGAQATFDFYGPGSHDWPYWERELHRAWPLLAP